MGPFGSRVPETPVLQKSYPNRVILTLNLDDLGTPDRMADPRVRNGHRICTQDSCLHHIVSQWNATRFGSKLGPFWGTPLRTISAK